MPFLNGSLSVRRYQVLDTPAETLSQTAALAIRRYSWQPIDDNRGEKESFGWINPRRVLQDSFGWDDVYDDQRLILGVRRDRKSYSSVLFKARKESLFAQTKEERGLQKLTRQQRLALEEQLSIQMLKETSPQSAFSEIVWDLNSNLVLMGATSNSLCERIQELFEATFDLKLRVVFPALIGAEYIESQGLEREFFATEAAR